MFFSVRVVVIRGSNRFATILVSNG